MGGGEEKKGERSRGERETFGVCRAKFHGLTLTVARVHAAITDQTARHWGGGLLL